MNQKTSRLDCALFHWIALSAPLALAGCSQSDATQLTPEQPEIHDLPVYTDSAVVDRSGGIVSSAQGRVVIPRNALAAPVEIAVVPATGGFTPFAEVSGEQIVAFLPHGTQFLVPVTVEVAHPHGAAGDLALYTSAPGAMWSRVANATFTDTRASARVSHFSFFFASDAGPRFPELVPREGVRPPSDDAGAGGGGAGGSGGEAGAGTDTDAGADGGDGPAVVNLVSNPDFESGVHAPWSAAFGGSMAVTTEQAHTGAYSAKVSNREQLHQGAHYSLLGIATADTEYAVSAFARIGGGSTATLRLTVRSRCAGEDDVYSTVNQLEVSDSEWSELAGTYTVPSCTLDELLLYVENAPAGYDIYVDDVSVTAL